VYYARVRQDAARSLATASEVRLSLHLLRLTQHTCMRREGTLVGLGHRKQKCCDELTDEEEEEVCRGLSIVPSLVTLTAPAPSLTAPKSAVPDTTGCVCSSDCALALSCSLAAVASPPRAAWKFQVAHLRMVARSLRAA
jgi:hypothetical protein